MHAEQVGSYRLGKIIGQGTYGKVRLAAHVETGERAAIKIIEKSQLQLRKNRDRLKREIKFLRLLHHPNIVKVYDIQEAENSIYIIMEYASGGELFDYIVSHVRVKEDEARNFFRQVLSAIDYCHKNAIIHRDLKPENLLLDEKMTVKIIDFGFGNNFNSDNLLETFCGSPFYAAPEMILGKKYKGPEVDLWSLGIILFALLCGHLPFDDENIKNLYRKIANGVYSCPSYVSPNAKDLIERLIQVDPRTRATLSEALHHPWVNEGYDTVPSSHITERPLIMDCSELDPTIVSAMTNFGWKKETFEEDWLACQNPTRPSPMRATYWLIKEMRERHISGVKFCARQNSKTLSMKNASKTLPDEIKMNDNFPEEKHTSTERRDPDKNQPHETSHQKTIPIAIPPQISATQANEMKSKNKVDKMLQNIRVTDANLSQRKQADYGIDQDTPNSDKKFDAYYINKIRNADKGTPPHSRASCRGTSKPNGDFSNPESTSPKNKHLGKKRISQNSPSNKVGELTQQNHKSDNKNYNLEHIMLNEDDILEKPNFESKQSKSPKADDDMTSYRKTVHKDDDSKGVHRDKGQTSSKKGNVLMSNVIQEEKHTPKQIFEVNPKESLEYQNYDDNDEMALSTNYKEEPRGRNLNKNKSICTSNLSHSSTPSLVISPPDSGNADKGKVWATHTKNLKSKNHKDAPKRPNSAFAGRPAADNPYRNITSGADSSLKRPNSISVDPPADISGVHLQGDNKNNHNTPKKATGGGWIRRISNTLKYH